MKFIAKIRNSIPYLLSLLFISGAIYKGLLPGDAMAALKKVGVTPSQGQAIIFGLVLIELYIGIQLLRPSRQVTFSKWSVYLLGIFTVFLVVLKSQGGQSCGCTGLERFAGNALNPILFGIARNLVMIGLVEWFLWSSNPAPAAEAGVVMKQADA